SKRRQFHQRNKPAPMKRPSPMLIALRIRIKPRPRVLDQRPRIQPRLQRDIRLLIRRIRPNRFRRQMRQIDRHNVMWMLLLKRRLPLFIQHVIGRSDQLRKVQIRVPSVMYSRKRTNMRHGPEDRVDTLNVKETREGSLYGRREIDWLYYSAFNF